MPKVIAAFNMTLDGNADHREGIPDEALHRHYAELIDNAGVILYGRTTYQLMRFWQDLLQQPSGKQSMDDFAVSIGRIRKLVFSDTLTDTGWDTAVLATRPLAEETARLKQQGGKDILVGSRSLIVQLLNQNLVDEFQICIHPVLAGDGLQLFDGITGRIVLKLAKTKLLPSGAIVLYYEPVAPQTTAS